MPPGDRRFALALALVLGAFAACGDGPAPVDPDATPVPLDGAPGVEPSADDVFDPTAVRRFELTVDPADWQWLNDNAQAEQYVIADLRYGDFTIEDIAVRYKGGVGTLDLCFDQNGQRICPKLSMKLKFDEYVTGQRFAGLKRLNFHSMQYDDSQMKDRLAYGLFRAAGVPAPRSVHARMVVNGEDLGLFALVEAIDGEFVEDHFRDIDGGEGNLYKEVWPIHTVAQPYIAALETNQQAAAVDRVVRFAEALAAADPATFRDVVSAWMDLPTLVSYLAVDRLIDDWDGFVGWYCTGDGTCINHNYYWYEETTQDRLWLLPWDMDNTFQSPNPIRDFYGVPDWNADPSDCALRPVFLGFYGRPPACDRFTALAAEVLWPDYQTRTEELLAGPASIATLEAEIATMEALLRAEVTSDDFGPGLSAWESAVGDLRADLVTLRARVSP